MKIIISPAKKMRREECILPISKPLFQNEAREIISALKSLTVEEKARIWKIKGALLREALGYLDSFDLSFIGYPSLFSYDGIQYTYMSPSSFTDSMLEYVNENLRIISGLYGFVRPLDGVMPYRLEMETKLKVGDKKNLYEYWGDKIASALEDDLIINLASDEYSKAVIPHFRQSTKVVTPTFLEKDKNRLITKGVYAKMARGEMVRFMAQEKIESLKEIKNFNIRGYKYNPDISTDETYFFVR